MSLPLWVCYEKKHLEDLPPPSSDLFRHFSLLNVAVNGSWLFSSFVLSSLSSSSSFCDCCLLLGHCLMVVWCLWFRIF